MLQKYTTAVPRKPKKRKPLKIGPLGTHNDKPFPCTRVLVHTTITDVGEACPQAETTIEYVFQTVYHEAEFYFPISELSGIATFTLTFNENDIKGTIIPEYPEENEMPARVNLPPQGVPDHPEKQAPHLLYHFTKGDFMTDMDVGIPSVMKLKYGYPLATHNGDSYICILPLSLLPKTPDRVSYSIEMKKKIRGISSANLANPHDEMRVLMSNRDKTAAVTLLSPKHSVRLDDDHFLLEITMRSAGDDVPGLGANGREGKGREEDSRDNYP